MAEKILIVDDDLTITRLIEMQLQREGYATVTANNGLEALNKVQAEKPDLLILDVMMPGMDGVEVCRRLRERPDTADLPIIMLSAKGQVSNKISGLRAGADEYATKPMDIAELIVRVEMLLQRTRRLRQAQAAQRGTVLGFIGAKGGVGTTTVALNLAGLLPAKKKSVLILELRQNYGTCALLLKKSPTQSLANLLDLESAQIDKQELNKLLQFVSPGVRILFGPQQVKLFRGPTSGQVEAIVSQAVFMADYVVLDLPSTSDSATQAAIGQCDRIGLVVEPEPTCIACAKVAIEMLASWGTDAGKVGIVVVNRSGTTTTVTAREIGAQLGCQIVGTVPFAGEACIAAAQQGQPVVLFRPDSLAACGLKELTDRLTAEKLIGITF